MIMTKLFGLLHSFITVMDKLLDHFLKPNLTERKNNLVKSRDSKNPLEIQIKVSQTQKHRMKLKDYIHLHQLQKSRSKSKSHSSMVQSSAMKKSRQQPKSMLVITQKLPEEKINELKQKEDLIKQEILRTIRTQKQKIMDIEEWFDEKFQISEKESNLVFLFQVLESIGTINESMNTIGKKIKHFQDKQMKNFAAKYESSKNAEKQTQSPKQFWRKAALHEDKNLTIAAPLILGLTFNPKGGC